MSYKVGQEYQHVMRNDGVLVSLPGRDCTPGPWENLVLFARAVAQCQNDVTGISLVICMARFGPAGIARLNAANMLSALTHPHSSGAIATAVRHNERDTQIWKNEQLAKEASAERRRQSRLITIRNLKGKVVRYEVHLQEPRFKVVGKVEDADSPRTWGIEHTSIRKFTTKKAALDFIGADANFKPYNPNPSSKWRGSKERAKVVA